MTHQCVILAGGLGTRLGVITADTPKPLLDVAGRPFLAHLVDFLRMQGIRRITILAGYIGADIARYFDASPDVTVLIEPEPLGTGGALRFAYAQDALEGAFFMINGDTFFDVNLSNLFSAPLSTDTPKPIGRIALRYMQKTGRYGTVERDKTLVTSFRAQPKTDDQPGYVNGGIYHLSRAILEHIPEGKVSLEAEVLPKLVALNQLHAFGYDRPFIDIGIVSDYEKSQIFVPDQLHRPALFLDRDGVINEDIGYLHKIEDFVWVPGARELIVKASDLGYYVFIVTNQAGIARGFYDDAQVHKLHDWLGDQVFMAGGRISDIRYCPHHIEGAVPELATPCSWRKPEPGMLLDLMKHHNIEKSKSLMVGDKQKDMDAAKAAGIKGVHFTGGDVFELVASLLESARA